MFSRHCPNHSLAAGDERETGTGSWNILQKRQNNLSKLQESVIGGWNSHNSNNTHHGPELLFKPDL
jgi:hypothetical protein